MTPLYYLLIVREDVEPHLAGPFSNEYLRDQYARSYRYKRDREAQDGLFPLDMDADAKLTVGTYSGGFFER